ARVFDRADTCRRRASRSIVFPVLVLASPLALSVLFRWRRALNSSDKVPDRRGELLLERARDPTLVDALDRLVLQAASLVECAARITGVEGRGDLVAPRRKLRRDQRGKLRPRSGAVFGSAPAAGEEQRGRQGRAQLTPSRSDLPPLQASRTPAGLVRGAFAG